MSDNLTHSPVLLVGAGPMSVDYANVLQALNCPFIAIGRGAQTAESFRLKTGVEAATGGLEAWLRTFSGPLPSYAIVATGVEALAANASLLLEAGVHNVLLEKPGGRVMAEIRQVADTAARVGAADTVLLAYNRRFYASVQQIKAMAEADGGIEAIHFEFTEWGHRIGPLQKAEGIKEAWFLANSTHVVDLAFYLGGKPEALQSFTAGGNDWHPSATIFAGAGRTERAVLFSYQAHWEAPGRWSVEVITRKRRYYLKPLEEVMVQENGTLQVNKMDIDDALDKQYKPGLYRQVAAWLSGDNHQFCNIVEQAEMMHWYNQMANYKVS